jgi:hypothetical protein
LAVRAELARSAGSSSAHENLGRVLERARDYNQAFAAYEAATSKGGSDPLLMAARDRMRYRTTPEVAFGFMGRKDPAATSQQLRVGAALPFGSRHLVSVLGWHESLHDNLASADSSVAVLGASLVLASRQGATFTLGGTLYGDNKTPSYAGAPLRADQGLRAGATAQVSAPIGKHLLLNVRGDGQSPWTEAPVGVQNGGAASGVTARVFALPDSSGRIIVDSGVQARRLELAPLVGGGSRPGASQVLLWTGVDFVLRHDPTRVIRGEILDDSMVAPSGLADSTIVSLRHYELFGSTGQEFASRINLIDRAGLDNASLVIRDAFVGGRLGLDMRVGVGWERLNGRLVSQAGLSLLAAPTGGSRFSLSYDIAQETMTGIVGTRQTGWLMYHADI